MTLKELADALEKVDGEAFASLLWDLELNHDDAPKQIKKMINFGGSYEQALNGALRGSGMSEIPVGVKGSFNLVVAPEHLANRFKDALLPPVLATPLMILAMENAALNAIRSYLEPGESAVGTAVDIRHIAATPVGQRVSAEAYD